MFLYDGRKLRPSSRRALKLIVALERISGDVNKTAGVANWRC